VEEGEKLGVAKKIDFEPSAASFAGAHLNICNNL
jgi:hypothetical protein